MIFRDTQLDDFEPPHPDWIDRLAWAAVIVSITAAALSGYLSVIS